MQTGLDLVSKTLMKLLISELILTEEEDQVELRRTELITQVTLFKATTITPSIFQVEFPVQTSEPKVTVVIGKPEQETDHHLRRRSRKI